MSRFARGETKDTLRVLQRTQRAFALAGSDATAGHAAVHVATVRYAGGDLDGALQDTADAIELLSSGNTKSSLAFALSERGWLLLAAGRTRDAAALLERLEEVAENSGFVESRWEAHAIRACERHAAGDDEAAQKEVAACIEMAAAGDRSPRRWEVAERLAIAALVSRLPVPEALARLLDEGEESDGGADHVRAKLLVRLALADQRHASTFEALTNHLDEHPPAKRRAEWRALRPFLEALAAQAAGQAERAAAACKRAQEAAHQLGHVPLERARSLAHARMSE